MDFFEAVEKRRSVRKFKPEPVPENVVQKAIDAALLAPNSSNLQPWEFYWVRSADAKDSLAKFCFGQGAAATAAELIVVVSRLDTWKRNRALVLKGLEAQGRVPQSVKNYYGKVVPVSYVQDPFGLLGVLKWIVFNSIGLFRPAPRRPAFRSELFEVVSKTTALACENLMLALAAQGYDSCPMEGFDESRVRRLLKLNRHCHVVMVIGLGKGDPSGLYGERVRVPRSLVVHEI